MDDMKYLRIAAIPIRRGMYEVEGLLVATSNL